MSKKKILIVGCCGFIGGYVSSRFCKEGWEVVGIDNINLYKPDRWKLFVRHFELRQEQQLAGLQKFHRLDVTHIHELSNVIDQVSPEVVLNVGGASVADVCKNNIEEAVSSIYLGNANLLQILKNHKSLERYVYISSSMTYGDFGSEPPREDSVMKPKDPYGAIKLGGEFLIHSFQRQFGVPSVIIRPSAVYGPLDSNMRVTGIFMLNAHLGRPLQVSDPGEQLDFTYVEDIVEGIWLACTRPEALNETFNLTRGEGRTIQALAQEVQKHFPGVTIRQGAPAEHMAGLSRPSRGALSIEKARSLLGFQPRYSLEQGIAAYAEEWRKIFGPAGTPL